MEASLHDTPDSVLARFQKNVARHPGKPAVAFLKPGPNGGEIQDQRTYKELDDETTRLAQSLLKRLSPGDRAVLVYPPSIHFTIAFLACLKAGIIAVPVFPPNPLRRDTVAMFAVICKTAEAKVALTAAEYKYQKQLAGIKERATQWKRSMVWPDDLEWIVTDHQKMLGSNNGQNLDEPSERIAFLQFTSGSTSDPKGVMITRDNLAHNLSMITADLKADESTVVVSWLPMYHDMGLIGSFLGVLYCGGSGYYISPFHFLQRPMFWMEAISKYRATHLQAPNFAFKLTSRKASSDVSLDLSSVRHIINAAEPVDTEGMCAFYDTFGKFGLKKVIYPTYGLAEHTVFVCSGGSQVLTVDKQELEVNGMVKEVESGATIVGCGYPARQGVDVRIVKDEKAVEDDIVGEVWVHSASKAAGYYGKPEESRHDFHAELNGKEYLRTGDLGFMHQSELFICGRLKDLIIVGGRNYYPQDIEATAEAMSDQIRPGCSAAFTIDPVSGAERVALVMELREMPDDSKTYCVALAQTIRAAINQEHALGVSSMVFLQKGTVPKTRSGKIARSWCRKGYHEGTLKIIHKESFQGDETTVEPLEIESPTAPNGSGPPARTASEVRNMAKPDILDALVLDMSRVAAVPAASIDKTAALITMMDSLTISQFKGLVEHRYHVRTLSDEYLFRESSSVTKLAEVVKLGYAPDDGGEGDAGAAAVAVVPGHAGGLAGKLGCPPGVVCTIM